MDYYQNQRISNSDLSRFKSEVILGKPFHFPPKAAQFGEALHRLLLEPEHFTGLPPGREGALLQQLADRVHADDYCRTVLTHSMKERIVLFDEPETGAPCKCKVDAIQYDSSGRATTILDLKTTSQPNERGFLESVFTYDYDRQAAFYLDATGADAFVFIGIQKVKPFQVFFYPITQDRAALAYGRKKYKALLKSYLVHHQLTGLCKPVPGAA